MKLFVGLDVSSEKLDVCFLTDDDDLSILLEKTFPNDLNGATAIKEQILKFTESMIFKKIVIGMESTSLYSFHLIGALLRTNKANVKSVLNKK